MAVPMDRQFAELLEFAERAGIEIRHAHLGGDSGGLAKMKNKRILFIDLDATALDQLEQTARALASAPELETQYLRPDLRQLIEHWSENKQ
ncbi:MAG TPA: hypothetical protein VG722_01720 [Tepidisphaeraceae bacterium]|nr:hypothetical protein [Tepidisphaeraceae bacterium]